MFSCSARARKADIVWDYSRDGDYSNILVLELANCSVKIYIPISPDNCKQTRLHQYHYSPHCFTQSAHVSNE